jgi:molecular chaperone GrpE (heat shock protein)
MTEEHVTKQQVPGTVPGTGPEEPESVDVDALQADRDQLFDRLQRLAAEFHNFNNPKAREKSPFTESPIEMIV